MARVDVRAERHQADRNNDEKTDQHREVLEEGAVGRSYGVGHEDTSAIHRRVPVAKKVLKLYGDGALGGIRTHDPSLRRAVLYPAELRARGADFRTEPPARARRTRPAATRGRESGASGPLRNRRHNPAMKREGSAPRRRAARQP